VPGGSPHGRPLPSRDRPRLRDPQRRRLGRRRHGVRRRPLATLAAPLFHQGKFRQAIAAHGRAAEAEAEDPVSEFDLATAYPRSGDAATAHLHDPKGPAICGRAIGIGVADPEVEWARATWLAHPRRGSWAVPQVSHVRREQPDDASSLFVGALVATGAGDGASALARTQHRLRWGAPPAWFSGPEFAARRGESGSRRCSPDAPTARADLSCRRLRPELRMMGSFRRTILPRAPRYPTR
jgi:hypothetical protein